MSDEYTIQARLRERIHNRHGSEYVARHGPDGSEWGYDAELDGRAAVRIDTDELRIAELEGEVERLREVLTRTDHDLKRHDPECEGSTKGIRPRMDRIRERISKALLKEATDAE